MFNFLNFRKETVNSLLTLKKWEQSLKMQNNPEQSLEFEKWEQSLKMQNNPEQSLDEPVEVK